MRKLFLLFFLIILNCKVKNIKIDNDQFITSDESVNLYAFVGEKISVIEFDPNENNSQLRIDSLTKDTLLRVNYIMDYGFKNKFKVIKNIFNKIKSDTIEFVSYNHYGRPGYENFETIILYLSKNEDGEYYHQKYQYNPVVETKKGIWTGINGESIKELFEEKKEGVLEARGIF